MHVIKALLLSARNTFRHLRLIKRQTGWCAPAGPLLNVSHLSPALPPPNQLSYTHQHTYISTGFVEWEKQRKTYRAGRTVGNEVPFPPLHSWPFFKAWPNLLAQLEVGIQENFRLSTLSQTLQQDNMLRIGSEKVIMLFEITFVGQK